VRPTPQGMQSVYAQLIPLITDLVDAEQPLSARERAAVEGYLQRVLDVLRAHSEIEPELDDASS